MVGGQPYNTATGQRLYLNNAPAVEYELTVQSQIQAQQLLSPTQPYQHKRQDSLFSISPSSGTMSSGPSPHQAEAQPCFPVTYMTQQTRMSHASAMMRSESQRSQRSTGSYQYGQYGQHRGSVEHGSDAGAVSMSRSSTHHSRTSLGYQPSRTAPQSYAALPQPTPSGYSSWPIDYTTPATSAIDANSGCTSSMANLANATYVFESDDVRGTRAAELDGVGDIFAQGNNTNEVFGQESPMNK